MPKKAIIFPIPLRQHRFHLLAKFQIISQPKNPNIHWGTFFARKKLAKFQKKSEPPKEAKISLFKKVVFFFDAKNGPKKGSFFNEEPAL